MSREMPVISFGRNVVEGGESTISDLARSYGVSLRTLRFYEDRGLLHPRRHGTMRYYGAADRVRLELILKGKRLGFTLSEIQDLISSRAKVRAPEASEVDSNDLTISLGREQIAAENRARFGRPKGEKLLNEAAAERATRSLDQHRIERDEER